ncbi:MAG: bestrophin-like domain [Dehalococcoidia bacterium]
MPFQQWVLIYIPTWIIGIVMVAIAIGISVGGVLLVHHFVKVNTLKSHHDIAGPIFATIGVVYAVMLSYVLIIVWQNFDKTNNNVAQEANLYADIYRDSNGLSEPFRSQFMAANSRYIDAVINDEWKLMALGQRSLEVQKDSDEVWKLAGSFEPKSEGEKIFFAEILTRMNDAGELRRQRLLDAQTGIHPMLWLILLFGGMITVIFSFFFGSENVKAQLIMTTLMAVLIVLILFTILIMDYPFSGDMAVSPDAFKQVLLYLKP